MCFTKTEFGLELSLNYIHSMTLITYYMKEVKLESIQYKCTTAKFDLCCSHPMIGFGQFPKKKSPP